MIALPRRTVPPLLPGTPQELAPVAAKCKKDKCGQNVCGFLFVIVFSSVFH
jgi:hypothetical protein